MNRIEKKLQTLQEKNEKAFITYITAGLPDMDHCAKLIRAQEEAGLDILELGIPFSDPAADGPVSITICRPLDSTSLAMDSIWARY